jgi:hypothetical protein
MMAKQSTKFIDNRNALASMLKEEPAQTPIQEVRPVQAQKPAVEEEEKLNGIFLPVNLMQQMRLHKAMSKKSYKEICTEALTMYFNSLEK